MAGRRAGTEHLSLAVKDAAGVQARQQDRRRDDDPTLIDEAAAQMAKTPDNAHYARVSGGNALGAEGAKAIAASSMSECPTLERTIALAKADTR